MGKNDPKAEAGFKLCYLCSAVEVQYDEMKEWWNGWHGWKTRVNVCRHESSKQKPFPHGTHRTYHLWGGVYFIPCHTVYYPCVSLCFGKRKQMATSTRWSRENFLFFFYCGKDANNTHQPTSWAHQPSLPSIIEGLIMPPNSNKMFWLMMHSHNSWH